MTFNSEAVLETLQSISDDFLNLTPEEMGIESSITSCKGEFTLLFQAGFPTYPLLTTWLPSVNKKLKTLYRDFKINTQLDFFIKAHPTQMPGQGLRGVKNTIAVASGKGGVGKSTVAVNLAIALARAGASVGILDADIYGPSIPLMLGNHTPVQIQDDYYLPIRVHDIQAMSIGYLAPERQALIWRGPMLAKSLLHMINYTRWDNLDYLLIDLPPGTGDIQLSLIQKIPLTGAVVITTPQKVATLDAEKAIRMFNKTGIDVLGLIENMTTHVCSQCGHHTALFGQGGGEKLSEDFNTPLLGQLPLDARIQSQSDEGAPSALFQNELALLFMKVALNLAIRLAKKG